MYDARLFFILVGGLILLVVGRGMVVVDGQLPVSPGVAEVAGASHSGPSAEAKAFPDLSHWLVRQGAVSCGKCHSVSNGSVEPASHFLNRRANLTESAWADSLALQARCGSCHRVPDPSVAGSREWKNVLVPMRQIMHYLGEAPRFVPEPGSLRYRQWVRATEAQWQDLMHYYYTFSEPSDTLDPAPRDSPLAFESTVVGHPHGKYRFPRIGHVNVEDVDRDGNPDILVSDFNRQTISWIYQKKGEWVEERLARVPVPGPIRSIDFNDDGRLDLVVACVGSATPTDKKVGSVQVLIQEGRMNFEVRTLLSNVGRVADVQAGDFDGDGDSDFVVGIFGNWTTGEIGWLEQLETGDFAYHKLSDKVGTVNVAPVHINGDSKLDFIALIAQEHEEVTAFVNRGDGQFVPHILFKAETPSFGSSGMELTDLDEDGDTDILFTNGDSFGLMIHSYHGVQWLENTGNLNFVYHDIARLYGAFRAVPGDMDRDGDLDVVAVSLMNEWANPNRKSLIWLENNGSEQFTPHGIGSAPTSLITASLADLTGDGRLDIVTGNMHLYEQPHAKKARVTLWKNKGLTDGLGSANEQ